MVAQLSKLNAKLVKQRLLELKLTPEDFAREAGFSRSTAYNILNGESVSDRLFFKAVEALKVEPADLLAPDHPPAKARKKEPVPA